MVRNILIAFCVILFVSCSKDTESKLFGKWQLTLSAINMATTRWKVKKHCCWN